MARPVLLNYCPFNTFSVPVDLWFTYQQFALKNPLHVANKLRNQLAPLDCHVLNLGDGESQDREHIIVRWDYVLELADRNEPIVQKSRLKSPLHCETSLFALYTLFKCLSNTPPISRSLPSQERGSYNHNLTILLS